MADNCTQNAPKMHGTRATPVISRGTFLLLYLSDTADSSLASESPVRANTRRSGGGKVKIVHKIKQKRKTKKKPS